MPRVSLCCTSDSSKSQGEEAGDKAPRKTNHPPAQSKDFRSELRYINMPSTSIHNQPPTNLISYSENTKAPGIPVYPASWNSNSVYIHPYYRPRKYIYPAKKIFITTLPSLPEVNEDVESKK
jgi:hypothetical protein